MVSVRRSAGGFFDGVDYQQQVRIESAAHALPEFTGAIESLLWTSRADTLPDRVDVFPNIVILDGLDGIHYFGEEAEQRAT